MRYNKKGGCAQWAFRHPFKLVLSKQAHERVFVFEMPSSRNGVTNEYTEYEILVLTEEYQKVGSNIPKLLGRHSQSSISATANRLGLKYYKEYQFGIDIILDPLWCSWFSGFFDGEGCLGVNSGQRSYRNPNPECFVDVNVRSDDASVIEEIRDKLKIGNIHINSLDARRAKGQRVMDSIHWRAGKTSHLVGVIIPLFDKYPLKTKKAVEWVLWKEAVMLRYNRSKDYRYRIWEIQTELRVIRGGAARGGWKEWSATAPRD